MTNLGDVSVPFVKDEHLHNSSQIAVINRTLVALLRLDTPRRATACPCEDVFHAVLCAPQARVHLVRQSCDK